MRLYISEGKIIAELDETIELCSFGNIDTLQKCKKELLKKISDRFDCEVIKAALRGMEEGEEKPLQLSEEPPKVESNEPESVPSTEEPNKKRAHIDIGKIMALKKAGWSNIKIADEMEMQPQSVASAIYQYKKKHEVEK